MGDRMPRTAWIFPALAVLFVAASPFIGFGPTFQPSTLNIAIASVLLAILFGTVFAAVYHAEVIAHRTGEPFGTLVLTVAVTVIEVALIASIMLGDKASPALARDTVFAVIMIVCNGLVGLCILIGGLRYREQSFRVTGANAYLAVLLVLATLSLILPNHVFTAPGPVYAVNQLIFDSVATIALYVVFLYIQTVRHQEYFVTAGEGDHDGGGHLPSNAAVVTSAVLLLIALAAVVLLSKQFAVVVDAGTAWIGAPAAFAGLVVAAMILLPEGVAAVKAARANELQKSLNLALGSSLATIGLTVPAVAAVTIALDKELVLGLASKDVTLFVLTMLVSLLTFGTGRTNILFGFIHLVIFGTFVFLVFVP
jgi:Ca2+:H+ antiporter